MLAEAGCRGRLRPQRMADALRPGVAPLRFYWTPLRELMTGGHEQRESGRARERCWLPGRIWTHGQTPAWGRDEPGHVAAGRRGGNENPTVLENFEFLLAAGADIDARDDDDDYDHG